MLWDGELDHSHSYNVGTCLFPRLLRPIGLHRPISLWDQPLVSLGCSLASLLYDISCAKRDLLPVSVTSGSETLSLNAADITSLGLDLLAPIGLDKFILVSAASPTPAATWPFPVEAHPVASSPLAKGMAERLKGDMELYAKQHAAHPKPVLLGFSPQDLKALVQNPEAVLPGAEGKARALLDALLALRTLDLKRATSAKALAIDLTKDTAGSAAAAATDICERKAFSLSRLSSYIPQAWFELLVTFLLSSRGECHLEGGAKVPVGHNHQSLCFACRQGGPSSADQSLSARIGCSLHRAPCRCKPHASHPLWTHLQSDRLDSGLSQCA